MPDIEITVAAKQRWLHRNTGQVAKVMVVSDGWVMARYKRSAPWCRHWKDFEGNFMRQELPPK